MAKYQLTPKQKEIIRAASKGLCDGSVKQLWNMVAHGDYVFDVPGFPAAKELGLSASDLRLFAKLGFLEKVSPDPKKHAYDVYEQRIHDAVQNDFEIPSVSSPPASIQTNIYGSLYGSNLNVAQYMSHINQSVESIPTLPDEDKAEIGAIISGITEALVPYEETHPTEVRDATRSIELLMGDLVEEDADNENIRGALARLKRSAGKLIFSSLAQEGINRLVEYIEALTNIGS